MLEFLNVIILFVQIWKIANNSARNTFHTNIMYLEASTVIKSQHFFFFFFFLRNVGGEDEDHIQNYP